MIKTYVIDTNSDTREKTISVLRREQTITIVGQSDKLVANARAFKNVDVILLRCSLPTDNAINLVQNVSKMHRNIKILVMGLRRSEASALAFIEAGACGYVYEDDSCVELIRNINAASEDRARISTRMAACLMERLQELKALSAKLDHVYQYRHRFEQLTTREQEVLELIGEGLSNRHIAEQLYVEAGTVKNHVHNILKKLQVRNRRDAAAFLAINHSPSHQMGGMLRPTFGD